MEKSPSNPSPALIKLREALNEPLDIPRGIPPETLYQHVLTTMPYLSSLPSNSTNLAYLKLLKDFEPKTLTHSEYFKLCVSAHFATCGTFVPTDVDNQIRFKLWHPLVPIPELLEMFDWVLEARHWNVRPVTTRILEIPGKESFLSGHRGEWLTIAAAAYGAFRRKIEKKSKEILELIQEEVEFEKEAYFTFKKVQDGVGLLKACAFIAHNIGDLNRVIEMWELETGDPLFDFAASVDLKEPLELYKAMMASECHRYFALRSAKCLRQSPDFLIPIGPFFDDWGKLVVRHPLLSVTEKAKVAEALIDGFFKLKNSIGYARALSGMETHFPGGAQALQRELPSKLEKAWKTGPIRQICSVPKEKFEAQWAQRAWKFSKEFRN